MTFQEFKARCGHRVTAHTERRRGNTLNVEFFGGGDYCLEQSPDGRGWIWYLSGGDIIAYGHCCKSRCPLYQKQET